MACEPTANTSWQLILVETLNGLWTHSQYKFTVDIKLNNRKYKNITVGTQVMTINTTARMATADYGNQKSQLPTHHREDVSNLLKIAFKVGVSDVLPFGYIYT
jgi:hypothetical protein